MPDRRMRSMTSHSSISPAMTSLRIFGPARRHQPASYTNERFLLLLPAGQWSWMLHNPTGLPPCLWREFSRKPERSQSTSRWAGRNPAARQRDRLHTRAVPQGTGTTTRSCVTSHPPSHSAHHLCSLASPQPSSLSKFEPFGQPKQQQCFQVPAISNLFPAVLSCLGFL